MKVISDQVHAGLDYLTVVIFLLAPTVVDLSGIAAIVSYILAVVHLAMTLVTDMPSSLAKLLPLKLHSFVEVVVGPVLILGALILPTPAPARIFFVGMGVVILAVWLLSDY